MGLGPNWYQPENKTCYIPKVKKIYVEKGCNLHLACKCLFYKPE